MPCETKLVPINRPNSLESWPNAAQRAPFRRPPAAACDRINAAHRLVDQLVTPCFRWLHWSCWSSCVSSALEVEESSIYGDDVAGDHHGEQYCPLDHPAATSIGASSVSSGVRNCWQYSYPQECCRYEWHKRAASRPNRSRAELSGQLDICGPGVELQGHGKLASTNRPPVSPWTVRMPTTLVNLEQRSCSHAPSR